MNTDLIIDKTNGEFENLLRFAWNHKDQASLKNCIDHLELICKNRNSDTVAIISIYYIPMSFTFAIANKKSGHEYASGRVIFVGGYKGVRTEPISIMLEPYDGWQLHIL